MGNSDSSAGAASGSCAACGEALQEQYTQAGDKAYHPACFKCAECQDVFGADQDYIQNDGAFYCEYCYGQKFSPKCDLCDEPIVAGRTMFALQREFHEECFKCSRCDAQCSDKEQFYSELRKVARGSKRGKAEIVDDDRSQEVHSKVVLLCKKCNFSDMKGGDLCAWCDQQVEQNGVYALNKRWHEECFACNDCGRSLLENGT